MGPGAGQRGERLKVAPLEQTLALLENIRLGKCFIWIGSGHTKKY
jgi:hypothetical protein